MQWIVINLFLLVMILAGAGTFWVLGVGVEALGLDDEVERWLLGGVAIASIFASYYAGKLIHALVERRFLRISHRNK